MIIDRFSLGLSDLLGLLPDGAVVELVDGVVGASLVDVLELLVVLLVLVVVVLELELLLEVG